jgi:hypothetical protein
MSKNKTRARNKNAAAAGRSTTEKALARRSEKRGADAQGGRVMTGRIRRDDGPLGAALDLIAAEGDGR